MIIPKLPDALKLYYYAALFNLDQCWCEDFPVEEIHWVSRAEALRSKKNEQ